MCVANSARSQLAEGLARNLFPNAEIRSAGSVPKQVNPWAIEVLKEVGVDISAHQSKSVEDLSPTFTKNLDYVITLCAEEVCPILPSKTAKKLHWPFPDPAGQGGTKEEELARFRTARDSIERQLQKFKMELYR